MSRSNALSKIPTGNAATDRWQEEVTAKINPLLRATLAEFVRQPEQKMSQGSPGETGQMCWDGIRLWVCIASNSWREFIPGVPV